MWIDDRPDNRIPYIDVEEDERGALVIWGDKGVTKKQDGEVLASATGFAR